MQDNKIKDPVPAYCLPAVSSSFFFPSNMVGTKPQSEDILKAIMFLKGKIEISIFDLQLEFVKGYNWAGKIMDILENNGLVSEFNGVKSRKVIADPSIFDMELIILDIDDVEP
jgi:hypothetical protein